MTGVEHKMGLNASATCEVTFGGNGVPATGWLLGEVHDGIAQMFQVIEYARMMVGTKAIGTLSTGYLSALEYAKERIQGADLTQQTNKAAPRVPITHHPDVRRSLMLQKAYAEGLRAIYTFTSTYQDVIRFGEAPDADRGAVSPEDIAMAEKVNDLLLPIVKGVGSERASEQLDRIAADPGRLGLPAGLPDRAVHPRREDRLAVRGHHGDPGAGLLLPQDRPGQRSGPHARGRPDPDVPRRRVRERAAQGGARAAGHRPGDVQSMLGTMIGFLTSSQEDVTNLYKVGQHAVRFLMSMGDLVIGWLLLRQAEVAGAALDAGASAGTPASTRARSPWRGSSPARCCPSSAPAR